MNWIKTVCATLFVLFMMPLGHALMITMEHVLPEGALYPCAFGMGALGMAFVVIGVFAKGDTRQTLWGLFGGLLFWTGWFEFLFMYYANRYGTQPQLDPETLEVVTKPEYLLIPATFGLWAMVMILYTLCTANGCLFINWCQRQLLRGRKAQVVARPMTRHVAVVTFMELMMLLWTSYLVLMFCYDPRFLGDRHPVTIFVAVGCLVGSLFIFRRQLHLRQWGPQIRMAIATVIVFWVPVEVVTRNGLLKEIWVNPLQYQAEMWCIVAAFVATFAGIVFMSWRARHVKAS